MRLSAGHGGLVAMGKSNLTGRRINDGHFHNGSFRLFYRMRGYIAFVRNRDKDKGSNVKRDATVLTEIGYIKANTDEIKAEQKEQRKTNTEFVTRLTDVEASTKQAHKRLDHIEKRMDQAE